MVVSHPGLECWWWRCCDAVVETEWRAGSPNAEGRLAYHLGKGAQRGFPWSSAMPRAVIVLVPRESRAAGGYVSNVIY
jgi:hypothetical protein